MDSLRFPLYLQQLVTQQYLPLSWALYADVQSEIDDYQSERGRPLTDLEIAYVRVISDWAVAETRQGFEKELLDGSPDTETVRGLAERLRTAPKRNASFGAGENALADVLASTWPPARIFRSRGIKEFIKTGGTGWTPAEQRLLWTGHFDFALCDGRGDLCLVLEYQGGGHTGRNLEEDRKVASRDATKQAICEKAGVPLLQIAEECAFLENHQSALGDLIRCLARWRLDAPKCLEILDAVLNSAQTVCDETTLKSVALRRKVYTAAGRGACLLALVWEIHELLGDLSPVPGVLRRYT